MASLCRAAVSLLKHSSTEEHAVKKKGRGRQAFIDPLSHSLSTPTPNQHWKHIGRAKRSLKNSI